MTKDEVIAHLKDLGDPRAIKVWEKMGMDTANYYGCGLTKLRNLAKKIKKNHALALELWETKNHDAMLLSSMIEEPKKVTKDQVIKQQADFDFWDLSDNYAALVVAKTTFANDMIEKWVASEDELIRRSGYILLSELAKKNKNIEDDVLEAHLKSIEKSITTAPNWTKEGMLYALMGIGSRNKKLNQLTLAVCESIGKIEIDYGDTSCETPDPLKTLKSDRIQKKLKD